MTQRFTDKDPADIVTVEFDFGPLAAAVTAPAITVALLAGTDATPSAILVGGATIDGAIVRQRVQGGVAGADYGLQCLAYNGSDRYSIEVVLPVRARPTATTATTRYVSQAEYERAFGDAELAELLAGGTNFAEVENAAASLVDGYLASRYTLPLVTVPQMLKGWTADIARFRLWDEQAPEEVRRRYEDAIEQLRDLSKGVISLPPGVDGAPASGPIVFGGYSNDRVFTSDTLCDY